MVSSKVQFGRSSWYHWAHLLDFHVTLSRPGGLSADVYAQLREAILDGRMRPGEALPATRVLAQRLGLSRNTVLNAYQRLIAEGFLVGRAGAGTFVGITLVQLSRRAPAGPAQVPHTPWADAPFPELELKPVEFDFQLGAPDPALFPWTEWRRLLGWQLRLHRRRIGYPPPEGIPALRSAIARHVGVSRSVRAGPADVLVTSGAQQAFDLLGRVLVKRGTCVAMEDPGYPPARWAFQAQGAKVVPVPLDDEGLRVDRLPEAARIIYVTPSHQFPLGMPMSLSRRMALLEWAQRRGAFIVEDDYDSEFRFGGRPLEPLQSLDRHGCVLYVGTFSKVLLPTLRIGFVVGPQSVMGALRAAKAIADSHGSVDPQGALAAFIEDGTFARHVRRLVKVYGERRERLLTAVARELKGRVRVVPSFAGLHVTMLFADRAQSAARALEEGIRIQPLAPYWQKRSLAGIALGYGLIPASRIDEGVRRLARSLR